MVATVHQHPIIYAGWTGAGYTIIDPETGAGGYKISGGSDGGQVLAAIGELTGLIQIADSADLLTRSAKNIPIIGLAINVVTTLSNAYDLYQKCSGIQGIQLAALTVILALLSAVLVTFLITALGSGIGAMAIGWGMGYLSGKLNSLILEIQSFNCR